MVRVIQQRLQQCEGIAQANQVVHFHGHDLVELDQNQRVRLKYLIRRHYAERQRFGHVHIARNKPDSRWY